MLPSLIRLSVLSLLALAAPAHAQAPEVYMVNDPLMTDGRINYPMVISDGRGYRIRCATQNDEEAMIAGFGFLLGPSRVLEPTDPIVTEAAPVENPLLCPNAVDFPIKVFQHDAPDGTKIYLQFPTAFGNPLPTDRIYQPGCSELLDALNVDLTTAQNADPTPFYQGKTHTIACRDGTTPLETTPQSFADWCMKGDLAQAEEATVVAMLEATPGGPGALGTASGCQSADLFLNQITTLNLNNANVVSLAPIGALDHLTSLSLAANNITDPAPLEGMAALGFLDLSDNNITSVAALSPLVTLTALDLSGNNITDLRPLSSLAALQVLDLGENAFTDLAPLRFLTQLKDLTLSGNGLTGTDLGILSGLSLLELLDISDNEIENFAPLADFPSTVTFILDGNPGASGSAASFLDLCILSRDDPTPNGLTIRAIIAATEAETCTQASTALLSSTILDLSEGAIADLNALRPLTHLTQLNLSANAISDVTPLAGLTQLTTLNIADNSITDVTPLAPLTQLTTLTATGNPARTDSFLAGCILRNQTDMLTEAQELEVDALMGAVGASTCAAAYTQLRSRTQLVLRNASLQTVNYLPVAENLQALFLSNNPITSVGVLNSLTRLTKLELNQTQVNQAAGIDQLRSLTSLDLAHTPVSDLSFLRSLPNLTTVNLRGTPIQNVRVLDQLPRLESAMLWETNPRFDLFIDFCVVHRFTPGLLGAQKKTMDAIIDVAVAANVDRTDCSAMQTWALNVTSLNLNNKALTNIQPLFHFRGLTSLYLANNNISDPLPLRQLRNLTTLNMSGNNLTEVPLAFSNGLRSLQLSDNRITKTDFLTHYPQLRTLMLNENRLTQVKNIPGLAHLATLRLENNNISSKAEAGKVLSKNPYLRGNPVCSGILPVNLGTACNRIYTVLINPVFNGGLVLENPSVILDPGIRLRPGLGE